MAHYRLRPVVDWTAYAPVRLTADCSAALKAVGRCAVVEDC